MRKTDRGTSTVDENNNPETRDVKYVSERDFRHSQVKEVLSIQEEKRKYSRRIV